ncbi:hypothetical protein CAPTEDRAFT_189571 [Capitella teleta]|uniref:Retrotransposon gag domain-containing protein n=1 Tax=Capitella teleta TaxID=283909 RepID=R7UF93_CAPTE|nr:hypothetical protein CAPTEDRAFT_189571 [Capitella teleta]|eukprot:ELU04783.1 hypothetical protein CAPTEDRAFT_189571 [Capitella teleta]
MSKQHRPQLDWTPDAKLPTRFKAWKAEIEDEILLFEGEDKPSKYICNFVKVCSGERGKAILAELNVYQEDNDYEVIFKALEKKVRPSNEEISASSKYFYLRQGNASLVDFFKQATETVEAMKIEENPKDKTLRNLLLNGLASREIYRECLKERADHLTKPHLSSRPTIQKIYTISTKAETTENTTDVKRPVVQKQTKNQRLNTQQDDSREAMLSANHTSQRYYNSHAKEREQLSELQHVWYKKDPVAHWQRGSVVQIADTPKSYVVQDDSGARYQRNSRHVRSATVPTDSEDPSDATPLVEPDRSKDVPRTFTETGDVITRSGRVSRKTVKYTA